MNFKQLISRAALTAAMIAVPAMAQSWSQVIDTDTSRDYGSDGMSTVIYTGATHKFVDGNTGVIEARHDLVYRSARKDDMKFQHVYLRFLYNINDIATFAENHKFSLGLRYRAPTDNTAQLEGSLGQLVARPTLVGTLGPVSYMVRDTFGPYLQRQRATRNQRVGPAGSSKANPLFVNQLEVTAGIPLGMEGLAFNAAFLQQNVYFGKANNANPYWSWFFEQDYEIRYAIAALDGLEVALGTTNGTHYKKDATGAKPGKPANKLWFNEGSTYGIRITKSFK